MTEEKGFDLRDQEVKGSQANIDKVNAPVFTGTVGTVNITKSEMPLIPRQIPPPPADFKGREAEISDILSGFDKGVTIMGVRGMGGIGKSALAFVLAGFARKVGSARKVTNSFSELVISLNKQIGQTLWRM
jgi:hypothetical protein